MWNLRTLTLSMTLTLTLTLPPTLTPTLTPTPSHLNPNPNPNQVGPPQASPAYESDRDAELRCELDGGEWLG
jgi:hypothetical protein